MPGSGEVLERSSMKLVPCTTQLCSDAVVVGGEVRYVNRAPFGGVTTVTGGINKKAPAEWQEAMWKVLQFMGSKQNTAKVRLWMG